MQAYITKQLRKLAAQRSAGGFSLTELLLGSTLTLAVVAAGGHGVASMIDVSTTANAKSERRLELSRALAFVEGEVRAASAINPTSASPTPTGFKPSTAGISDFEPVLVLEVAGVSQPVIYYLGTPADDTWKGPKVIYRWGPSFDSNGQYTNAGTASSWSHQPLIDKIENNKAVPTCPTDWTGSGAPGFYVCVNPSGTVAQVQQIGQIQKVLGQTAAYTSDAQVAVRSTQISSATFTPAAGKLFAATPNGPITVGVNSTMRIEFKGGEITCGAGGLNIPTRAVLNFNSDDQTTSETVASSAAVYTKDVAAGTTLTITGIADGDPNSGDDCSSYYMEANSSGSPQVIALTNGDTVPSYVPFDNQGSLDSYLSSIIDGNGKVRLAPNEVVFLYELGTSNTSSPAFDMQDIVVKATITPTQCNKGSGNGSENCDPGSNPNNGNDDEGGAVY
jgi:hypothetical protein